MKPVHKLGLGAGYATVIYSAYITKPVEDWTTSTREIARPCSAQHTSCVALVRIARKLERIAFGVDGLPDKFKSKPGYESCDCVRCAALPVGTWISVTCNDLTFLLRCVRRHARAAATENLYATTHHLAAADTTLERLRERADKLEPGADLNVLRDFWSQPDLASNLLARAVQAALLAEEIGAAYNLIYGL